MKTPRCFLPVAALSLVSVGVHTGESVRRRVDSDSYCNSQELLEDHYAGTSVCRSYGDYHFSLALRSNGAVVETWYATSDFDGSGDVLDGIVVHGSDLDECLTTLPVYTSAIYSTTALQTDAPIEYITIAFYSDSTCTTPTRVVSNPILAHELDNLTNACTELTAGVYFRKDTTDRPTPSQIHTCIPRHGYSTVST